jgi:hypothetical protein
VWGVIGTVAVGLAVLIALFRLRAVPRRELWAVVAAIALTGAIYLRLPHEGAYLLPIVPFVLLFVTRALGKPGAVALASLLVLSSLFVNVSERDNHALRSRSPVLAPVQGYVPAVKWGWGEGPLLVERNRRIDLIQTRDLVLERADDLPSNTIVAVYELLPAIEWMQPDVKEPKFVHLLTPASLELAKQEGRPVFATEDAWDNEWQVYRVRPEQFGVRLLSEEPNSL